MAVHSREAAAAGVDAGGGLRQAPGATAAERASGPTSGQRTLGSPRCLVYLRPGPGRDGRRGQAHGLTWSPTVYPRYTNGRCLCCWLRGGRTRSPGDRSRRGRRRPGQGSRPPRHDIPAASFSVTGLSCALSRGGRHPSPLPTRARGPPTAGTAGVSRLRSCPLGAERPRAETLRSGERPPGSELRPCHVLTMQTRAGGSACLRLSVLVCKGGTWPQRAQPRAGDWCTKLSLQRVRLAVHPAAPDPSATVRNSGVWLPCAPSTRLHDRAPSPGPCELSQDECAKCSPHSECSVTRRAGRRGR